VYLGGSLPLVPTLVKWVAAALILILFAVTSFSKTPERRLTFLAYGIWVPAVAGIALFIKTIPIDFVTTIIFREFMEFYFQILILSLWTYLVSLLRSANLSPVYFSAIAQITFSLFLLFGYVIQTLGYPLNTTVLGVITACFLIYAIITVGRNIILSSKGPESEVEIPQSPLSIEATCNAIGLEYRLSPREVEVLKELAHGHASSYVAKVLYISNNTARSHMKNIYKKLEISSREELLKLIWKGQ
ncbi:MAG: LuxR C-terminal-related transcriptional regulator, partial [Coriobacteriia bacterium]|nr:LuxR C-terminal-related transcriptional regulator [Coriobacteriia bacterium]